MDNKKKLSARELRRLRRKREVMIKTIILFVFLAVLVVILLFAAGILNTDTLFNKNSDAEDSSLADELAYIESINNIIAQADALAVQYDYSGAIELLKTIKDYDQNADVISRIANYEVEKTGLVAWSPGEVTHVFFHSLIVDPVRGFSLTGDSSWDSLTIGFCEWMTTIDEFDAIISQMYERGYVLVSIYDIVERTLGEDGAVHISPKTIFLPEGKIPFVLSVDDLSYYHSYEDRGIASKMIIGEDGTPTCEYIDANGNVLVGSYDIVPRMDDFIKEHPDFSYKGAKGIIAMTGYNGILGYRTDYCYRDSVELSADQEEYLAANPDFDWNAQCEEARAVAECVKEDGWIFASHTWGHIHVGDIDLETLRRDTEKWMDYVEPLIGETDIIVFAHGQDLANWDEDYASSEKFQYLKDLGFNIFCNVDSAKYFVDVEDLYLRMGRRNLDGYRIYNDVYGGADRLSDLFDAADVFDPLRPVDTSLYI